MQVAIIGCGSIASAEHIPAYLKNPETEIRYFCDIIPERAQAAVEKNRCGQAIADYRVALADPEVAAVSVCTPNDVHARIAIDAMKAGKHVLCEKPAARTWDEVRQMIDTQHETGMTLNIGVVNRFNDSVRRIKQYIDAGRLGEVYHVYVSFRAHRSIPGIGGPFTTKAIAGGGALIDWGVHYLDLVMYCLGDPQVKTVSGETFCKLGRSIPQYTYSFMWAEQTKDLNGTYDVDDSVTALIRTDGPVITLHGAWAQNIGVKETFIDFMGDRGGIRLDYGGKFTFYGAEFGALVSWRPEFEMSNMYQNEIDAFVDAIKTGKKTPAHIDAVAVTARTMQAIYDSAERHAEVRLD